MKNCELISWEVIQDLFESRADKTNSYTTKLTRNHVYLNSSSRMNVRYAFQVLSGSVADAIEMKFPLKKETAAFVRTFNKFIDCLNGEYTGHGIATRNPNLEPYRDPNDPRLDWLVDVFLKYFKDWEHEVIIRFAKMTPAERDRHILPRQTVQNIERTVMAFREIVRFMLVEAGAEFFVPRASVKIFSNNTSGNRGLATEVI